MVVGKRTAVLFCYEQLLVWPIPGSAIERSDILISIANDYWTLGTQIPLVQKSCFQAWARLFLFPFFPAANTKGLGS
jgi:hypothetical protein